MRRFFYGDMRFDGDMKNFDGDMRPVTNNKNKLLNNKIKRCKITSQICTS